MSDRTAVYIDNEIDPIARPERQAGEPVKRERVDPMVMRPVFRLSDFVVVVRPHGSYVCEVCGVMHRLYTHGCQPVAFIPWIAENVSPRDAVEPAVADAVPLSVIECCPIRDRAVCDPHRHEDFRWEE